MDKYRLIASIVVLITYLLVLYPIPTIVTGIALLVAYLVLSRMGQGRLGDVSTAGNGREVRRREALRMAKIYLSPYKDIWRNLKLTNKFCSLRLGSDGSSISARDLTPLKRSFRVLESKVHSSNDLWDMFCVAFSHNTTFEELVQLCETYQVRIAIDGDVAQNKVPYGYSGTMVDIVKQPEEVKEKTDINNASEVELTILPGISIVTAKRLINRREEIGGFKSVSEVFTFLKLKPHLQSQLKPLICVNKMKGSIKIKRYEERNIDL